MLHIPVYSANLYPDTRANPGRRINGDPTLRYELGRRRHSLRSMISWLGPAREGWEFIDNR